MSPDTVCDRYPEAVAAVREFFAQFYESQVVQTEDLPERLVLFRLGRAAKTVAVTDDFLAEVAPKDVHDTLASWNVPHLSRTLERRTRLRITSEGPEEEAE